MSHLHSLNPFKFLNVAALLAILIAGIVPVHAAVPLMINYQGKIEVTAVPYNGSGYFKFSLINDPTSPSSNYWTNDGSIVSAGAEPTSAIQLPVTLGLFTVKLGDTNLSNMTGLATSVFTNSTMYLRVWFSTDGIVFEQLSPDRQLVSVPYAMHAETADDIVGTGIVTSTEILDGTITNADISNSAAITASKINTSSATNLVSRIVAGSGVSLSPVTGVGDVTITVTGSGAASDLVCTNCVESTDITDGTITTTDLAFDPATQTELDTHKSSTDHDGRYFTENELNTSDGSAPNAGSNRVHWDNLTGVPAGFADGTDDTGGGGSGDVTDVGDCTTGECFTSAATNPGILHFEGTTNNGIEVILQAADATVADKTITLPNASGTVAVSASSPLALSAAGDVSIGTVDISGNTNLAVTAPITLTGDTVGITQHAGTDVTADLEEEGQINATAVTGNATAATGQVLRSTGANAAAWGALDLSDADAVTGPLDISSNTNLAVTAPVTLTGDTIGLGTVDISGNTNLAVTAPITLTGDTLGLGTADISTNTNLVAGTNITLTNDTLDVDDAFILNTGDTITGNLTFTKADPAIILDTSTATDTDFWVGVQEDAGSDDDDVFQIGDGTSPGTNAFVTVDTNGNVGIGDASPDAKLDVQGTILSGGDGADGQVQVYSEQGATDYTVTFNPHAAMTQNVTYTLPADDGAASQFLQTDGSGNLVWAAPAGGGDVTDVGSCASGACLPVDGSTHNIGLGTQLVFEGTTDDGFETLVTPTDPSADRTITLPNASGTVAVSASSPLALSAAGDVSLGTVDVSSNTNLAVTAPVTLTGDTIGLGTVDISGNTNLAVTAPITLTGDTVGVSDVFLLNTGDAGTGVYDFGGATSFEIPNAAAPALTVDGQIALEADADAINIQAGSGAVGGVPANTDVALPLIQQKDITLLEPDQIQTVSDAVPMFTVDAYNYPNGITITAIRLATDASSTLAINVEEWTSPTDGAPATLDNIATSASTETTETTITDAAVAAGSYVMLDLDTTNVNWAKVTIWYYVND